MTAADGRRRTVRRLSGRLPLLAKVGLPVLGVSIASAWLLGQASTAEVLSQCDRLGPDAGGLCTDEKALAAIGDRIGLLATDVTAVTLVALWLVFHVFVLRPTSRLASAAGSVAEGDLRLRLPVEPLPGTRDELTRVGVQFNRMVSAVTEGQRHVRDIVDTAYDAFISLDETGNVVDWSRQAETLFGWSRAEALGSELSELIIPERYRAQHRAGLAAVAVGGAGRVSDRPLELPGLRRDGTEVSLELVIWSTHVEGQRRFHSFLRDISERKRMEAQLAHQAFHDPLTGLANRSLFSDRLEHALQRPGAGLGVIFCDLDDFKTVNDSLGHAAGDQLLLIVADRLAAAVRPTDTLSRLAGDEFAVLVEDAPEEEAVAVAHRLAGALGPAIVVDGREMRVRVSIGVAATTNLERVADRPERGEAEHASALATELLRNADAAMYAAKRRGKDTVERFRPEMHHDAVERLGLTADLQRSIVNGELHLVYQPYVETSTGRITGCEALARWQHPTRGLVPPAQFIPLAEENGFIRELGRWVLRQACSQLTAWRHSLVRTPTFTMSVNVSVRQLDDPSFVEDVRQILADTATDPGSIVLEITESALSQDHATVLERIHRLKDLGLKIALDDFGTGYSSLARLGTIPVDVIKIDRSFIAALDGADALADASLVAAIVRIGADRNLRTVAEGVETGEQLAALRDIGCDVVQGFVAHRPMPAEMVAKRLQARSSLGASFDGLAG